MAESPPTIVILAGVNGAGKSSIAGATLRSQGGEYFNPDEAARKFREKRPKLTATEANALAWNQGVKRLRRAIAERTDFTFEMTLGGDTIVALLEGAAKAGFALRVWYVGLRSPELHLARVAARVRAGGHDIPEADVRRRYTNSRLNLIRLLPKLTELQVHDNSEPGDPRAGLAPSPVLVLHLLEGDVVGPDDLTRTPAWAKAFVAAALKLRRGGR